MFSSDDKLTEFSAVGPFSGIVLLLNGLRIFARYLALARTREALIGAFRAGSSEPAAKQGPSATC
jgi:hypothetical protein